jgi:hypothetical protein
MSTPTIPAGNLYMNATLYTGTGASLTVANGVAGQNFQPDLVWFKNRSNAQNNHLMDVNRGGGDILYSNLTNAEDALGTSWANFTSTGFSIGAGSGINNSGNTFVAWQWKANGSPVSNTSGSITSQVSANTTSGFSVVTFTAQGSGTSTIGHGLGVSPSLIITKARNATLGWPTYHSSVGLNNYLLLNTTASTTADSGSFISVSSSTFGLGTSFANGNNYVAYCWAPIAGYSAFGSYTGNGSTDGTFVYTGFRPRFLMIKRTDTGGDWVIQDSARSSYNASTLRLWADLSNAETDASNYAIDFVSNGMKHRNTNADTNASGGTYIYAAFAENPFKYANAR